MIVFFHVDFQRREFFVCLIFSALNEKSEKTRNFTLLSITYFNKFVCSVSSMKKKAVIWKTLLTSIKQNWNFLFLHFQVMKKKFWKNTKSSLLFPVRFRIRVRFMEGMNQVKKVIFRTFGKFFVSLGFSISKK